MNKKIAPIVVGSLICIYLSAYIFFLLYICSVSQYFKFYIFLGTVTLIILVGMTLFVVKQRIDEIESGEEDDISKY